MSSRITWLLVGAAALSISGCGAKVECGSGTKESNGRCVAEPGETGTEIECGAGTEEEDGQCVVTGDTVTCGAGTMLDANTGECVRSAGMLSCGTNTAYDADSDSCLPTDTVCAAGTTFDPAGGVCMPDVACEAGDVVIDGICVGPFEELWATATVISAENDDPFLGGTATSITLEAEGTELVLAGTIDPAADLDADGILDNDADVFEFTTTGPEWLTIAVQSDTEALMGFYVVNEDESWQRSSPVVGPRGNAREVLIPAAGTYRVGFGSAALGHAEGTRWVASVQDDAMPTPGAFTFGGSINGNFDTAETGLLNVANFTGAADLVPTTFPLDAEAAVMVFDGTAWSEAGILGGFPPQLTLFGTGGLQFFIDPTAYGSALDRAYVVDTVEATSVPLGTIAAGQTLMSAPTTIDMTGTIFSVDAAANVVLEVSTNAPGGFDLEVLSPFMDMRPFGAGDVVAIPMLNAGSASFRVTSFGQEPGIVISVTAVQPTDLGTVPAQGTLPVAVGDLTGGAYYTVAFAAGDVGRLQQTNTAANGLEVGHWSSDWTTSTFDLLEDSTSGFGNRALTFQGVQGPQLFDISSFAPLTGLTLTFSGVGTTPLGTFDPGDTLTIADPAPRTAGESEFYSFTLSAEAFALGTIDALGDDVDGRITDAMGAAVWNGGTGGGEDVAVLLPPGDYTLSVIPFSSLASGFTVDIDLGSLPSTLEVEPNNTAATATPGLAIGTDILGTQGDDDWYSFTAATAGVYTLSALSLGTGDAQLALADSAGNLLSAPIFPDANTQRGFLEAGDYTVSVSGFGMDDYILSMSRSDSGAAVDDAGSNDTSATAQTLSSVPADTAAGMLLGAADEDWYTFTLAAPVDVFVTASSSDGESRATNFEVLDAGLAVLTPTAGAYSLAAGVHYVRMFGTTMQGFPDYTLAFGTLPGTSYSSTPALAIPDNGLPATVNDIINVPSACTLTNIVVQIDLTHTFIGDLEIHLLSPTGTDVTLWDRTGGGSADIVGIFGLDLSSAEPLSGFLAEQAMGDWTITVGDGAGADTGTLNSWALLVDCQ